MACSSSDREQTDPVKQQAAAHWDRKAAHFDEDFCHSIRTAAERAAWDRILDLILPAGAALEALDIGCGTGFLSLELAFRGHLAIGVDFAPSMIAQARKKAAESQATIRYEEADAEQLPFCCRQLRYRRQPAPLMDMAAPGAGDGRMDSGASAGRAAHRRRQPG